MCVADVATLTLVNELDRIVTKFLDQNVATCDQSAGSIYADLSAFKLEM
jgi:hypothetical protein